MPIICLGPPSLAGRGEIPFDLKSCEIGIEAFLTYEFVVGPAGRDATAVDDQDAIRAADGGESMCDHDRRSARLQSFERLAPGVRHGNPANS